MSRQPFSDAFTLWLTSFSHEGLIVARPCEGRDAIEFRFPHAGTALEGYADKNGISVSAVWNEESWDFLLSEDLVAEHGDAGWFCALCLPGDRADFPTREDLWRDHLFRALDVWIETKLRFATGVAFFGGGGMTGAKLADTDDGDGHFHQFQQVNLIRGRSR